MIPAPTVSSSLAPLEIQSEISSMIAPSIDPSKPVAPELASLISPSTTPYNASGFQICPTTSVPPNIPLSVPVEPSGLWSAAPEVSSTVSVAKNISSIPSNIPSPSLNNTRLSSPTSESHLSAAESLPASTLSAVAPASTAQWASFTKEGSPAGATSDSLQSEVLGDLPEIHVGVPVSESVLAELSNNLPKPVLSPIPILTELPTIASTLVPLMPVMELMNEATPLLQSVRRIPWSQVSILLFLQMVEPLTTHVVSPFTREASVRDFNTFFYLLTCSVPTMLSIASFVLALFYLKETVKLPAPISTLFKIPEVPADEYHLEYGAIHIIPTLHIRPPELQDSLAIGGAVASVMAKKLPFELNQLLSIRFLFKNPAILIALGNFAFLSVVDITFRAIQLLFLANPAHFGGLGLPAKQTDNIISACGISNGIIQLLFFAKIHDHLGPRKSFLYGVASAVPLFLMFPVMGFFAKYVGHGILLWLALGVQVILFIGFNLAFGEDHFEPSLSISPHLHRCNIHVHNCVIANSRVRWYHQWIESGIYDFLCLESLPRSFILVDAFQLTARSCAGDGQ
ncbi:hypothetical protein C0989_010988 [Termitomyces sp. Mn162]|nr:hypothetical protein C0989_010988 [Termitomyces sp. Mn162]